MNKWFMSDPHLGHKNIIKYCGRTMFMTPDEKDQYQKVLDGKIPMKAMSVSDESLEKMNGYIINAHNARVKNTDIVFCLGDFCFRNTPGGKIGEGVKVKSEDWMKKMNGNFTFIQGNHDRNNSLSTPIVSCVIEMGRNQIYLCHNPEHIDKNYDLCFVGHVHNNWKFKKIRYSATNRIIKIVNVGLDVWGFSPCSYNEIMSGLKRWEKTKEGKIIHEL